MDKTLTAGVCSGRRDGNQRCRACEAAGRWTNANGLAFARPDGRTRCRAGAAGGWTNANGLAFAPVPTKTGTSDAELARRLVGGQNVTVPVKNLRCCLTWARGEEHFLEADA